MAVDPETATAVRAALTLARTRGVDVAQTLDQAGLLDHPAKARATKIRLLLDVAWVLEQMTVGQVAGKARPATTPLDMKRHVVLWLEAEAEKLKKERP
jgi:hypothetical protein